MTKKRYLISAQTLDRKGKLIASAQNNYKKSHPIQAHFAAKVNQPARIYLHAEIAALLKSGDSNVHTLIISSPDTSNVFPCKICQEAIKFWGVQRVILKPRQLINKEFFNHVANS